MQEHSIDVRVTGAKAPVDTDGEAVINKLTADDLALIDRAGFHLLGESYRADIDTQFITVQHRATGATISLVQNDDPHLRAELCFRTLPDDNTGAFHTLER